MTVTSATTPTTATTTPTATTNGSVSNVVSQSTIAGNFNTFLQLLTTQLQNQNPLDPLDTNQFTQKLVQFAQVEQQLNTNTSLSTLISLQQSSAATGAVSLLGQTVTVSGATSTMNNDAVQTCIQGRFLQMQFPKPHGNGIVIVKYPFLFSPGA